MKVSSFEQDLLDLQPFAVRLEKFIQVEHRYVDGSLVIGLNSKFGSGKSTFLTMWKDRLSKANNDESNDLHVISINAWESDYYGDPLFALISALVASIDNGGQQAQKLRDAAKDFGWFITAIGNQIVQKATGVDPVAAGEIAAKKKSVRENQEPFSLDSFSAFEARKNAMTSLKTVIGDIFKGEQPNALILVDELDRCRPDYAVTYLETIKHIFDIKGLVFILAVDRKQLECSARTAFGDKLDFEEYYRKFVDRDVTLPSISNDGYKKLAASYVDYYLREEGLRNCFMKIERSRIENISELIGLFQLTPRQIQEIFRILGHIFDTDEKNKGRLNWCLAVGSILMSILRIGNPQVYSELGNQNFGTRDAAEFFGQLFDDVESVEWWFLLCLTGGGLKKSETYERNAEDVFRQAGLLLKDQEFQWTGHLGQWSTGWGFASSKRFNQIYTNIEEVSSWA